MIGLKKIIYLDGRIAYKRQQPEIVMVWMDVTPAKEKSSSSPLKSGIKK